MLMVAYRPSRRLIPSYVALDVRVQFARRFVENEDVRVLEQRPSDRDALFLSAREPNPVLTEFRVVALWKFLEELSHLCVLAGSLDIPS